MEQIRSSGLEEQLAYHTAPVLMGIKPAGLFSVGQALGDTWKQIRAFHQKMAFSGLRIRILCSCKKRLLLFVYQEQRLEAALSPSIRTLLRKKFGYRQTQSLDAMLSELAEHIQQSATFPHEMKSDCFSAIRLQMCWDLLHIMGKTTCCWAIGKCIETPNRQNSCSHSMTAAAPICADK